MDNNFASRPTLLFERAAAHVGLDFLAHPFWDKYLEYEERQEARDKILAILRRVIHIPMHQYARYFERFRQDSQSRPLSDLGPADTLARFRSEVEAEATMHGVQPSEADIERDMRVKVDAMLYEIFTRTQSETNKRWTYESEIKRPYFHVNELEHQALNNWRKYLDFEESEGNYARILCLYERCLVTCAFYDEFWFRYARWMSGQEGKEEEVRNIYIRVSTIFAPISRPGIRLQWAYFEESTGRNDVARDIHKAVLAKIPDCVEAIISWANFERRHGGLDAAIEVYKAQIDSTDVNLFTKAILVAEWAFLLWKVKDSADEARTVFVNNVQWYLDSRQFWQKWLEFELAHASQSEDETTRQTERINNMYNEMKNKSRLLPSTKKELCLTYMNYLQQRGGKDAMKQFLALDREVFGPSSVSFLSKAKTAGKENGTLPTDLDEATRIRAESRLCHFYELHRDADPTAQGTAYFH